MIDIGTALRHYKRAEIQEEIIYAAQNKEAVAKFGEEFGQRPDVLKYPKDILELAKKGATSFHVSEEMWSYPSRLSAGMGRAELDELRTGWDLVLDIDCAFLEYSKITADEISRKLKRLDITSISVKFSGNKGFHIGIPFEAFPDNIGGKEARLMFPEAARDVATYIKEEIKRKVVKRLLEMEDNNISVIKEKTGKEIPQGYNVNAKDTIATAQDKVSKYIESFLNIDTVLISSRHLYRVPYSLHEKSGLVSVPINPERIMEFEKQEATTAGIQVPKYRFLDRSKAAANEAKDLFVQASKAIKEGNKEGWPIPPVGDIEERKRVEYSETEGAIPQQYFPPCMQKILAGLEDGRKRALFILTNFLASTGWEYKDIENAVKDWNQRNKPPLNDAHINSHLSYFRQKKKKALPPNCINPGYYADMGIKCHEEICSRCKNPVVFAKRKMRA
ncbi:hypothetical protein HYV82_01980 [Candidatus Woesearchaeota archaeon]|nr:hypothetical protein [Candidatus Woesearchaeota archaeon]